MNTGIMQLLGVVLSSAVVTTIVVPILLNHWLKARIEQSIKHEYDKILEDYRNKLDMRNKAAVVADLFSRWLILKEDKFIPLNKLSIEASLWLPDDIAIEIGKCLANAPDSKSLQELVISCRKLIQKSETKLQSCNITLFGV